MAITIKFPSIGGRAVKVIGGVVAAIFVTVVGGIILNEYTKTQPQLHLIVNRPFEEFGGNKIRQVITLRNKGETLAIGVRIVLESMKWRMDYKEIQGIPPLMEPCGEKYNNRDDLLLICGNLQPNAIIIIRLTHRRPSLRFDEIKAFSDNSTVENIKLDDYPGITLSIDR